MEERAPAIRCYSRLSNILSERKMTVADLARELGRRDVHINLKTLYRLTDPIAAIERLDMGVAGEICKVLRIDLSVLVSFEASRRDTGFKKLPPGRQRRLDALLDHQSTSELSVREKKDLAELVREAEELTLHNARTLARARHAVGGT